MSPSPFRELAPCTGWVQEFGTCSRRYGLTRQFHAAAAHWRAGRLMAKIWRFFCHVFLNLFLWPYRMPTSRAVQTPCRTSKALSWSWALYSSSWHTWSRNRRRPSRGKIQICTSMLFTLIKITGWVFTKHFIFIREGLLVSLFHLDLRGFSKDLRVRESLFHLHWTRVNQLKRPFASELGCLAV